MKTRSFRGMLKDEAIQTISLHTNTGTTGYRIKKFQLICNDPTANNEAVVKVFSVPQTTTPTTAIDFSDETLLAAGLWSNNSITHTYADDMVVIFDNSKFNQDIYVTHKSSSGQLPVNYYLELEIMSLDLNENTVATLKDIRNQA
jgi:hypothetical protein